MIILKSLLTGANSAQPTDTIGVTGHCGKGSARGDTLTAENKTINKKIRKMEFMYCIPDLELFIDKTIKKCLLEYDLDANDTEAVLDDMEKAWPKSPLRSSEKQVLKDCNDNSQKIWGSRQDVIVNQFQEATLLNSTLDKDSLKGKETMVDVWNVKDKDSRELTDRLFAKKEEPFDTLSNGKKEVDHIVLEGDRSDTSSPDVVDGQTQARKHPKLKSLLQQRYFGGQESLNGGRGQAVRISEGKLDVTWGPRKHISSNLDLLASAADIHTESVRGTEEHRLQAIRRLQEESERQLQINGAKPFPSKIFHESAVTLADAAGRMPVLMKLMSASSSPMREFNNLSNDVISVPRLGTVSPETSQRSPPGRLSNENPHLMVISRPEVKKSALFLSRNNTQQVFLSRQNGYHAHTPQETIVVRRDLSASSNEENMRNSQMQNTVTHSSLKRNTNIDLTPSIKQYNNFTATHHTHLLQHNHLDHQHNFSENFIEPLHYHGSRIASIIAEELQKDDDSVDEPQTHNSTSRSIHREIKPSDINEPTRIRSFSLPGSFKRATPSKSASYQVSSIPIPLDIKYKVANPNGLSTSNQSRAVFQILPAHYTMTNTHSGNAVLSSHLGHTVSIGSNATTGNSYVRHDEDQPQDLSTKSRSNAKDKYERQYPLISNRAIAAIGSKTNKYFSAPASNMTIRNQVHYIGPTSPHSDCESNCDSMNMQIKSYDLESKGQVQSFEIYPDNVKDSKSLARNKRPKLMNPSSETGDSQTIKRGKFEGESQQSKM